MYRVVLMFVCAVVLEVGTNAVAASTPEGTCQVSRYQAAAKYASCHQKFLAKVFGGGLFDNKAQAKLSKCRDKYRATWARLQAKANGTGSTCDTNRFVDNGNGTVTDYLTGLQWEKKTSQDDTPNALERHDADNLYTWSATTNAADGTAYTDFLAILNGGACFAGHCDWRLPTVAELQTILLEPYSCPLSPCIDASFGPAGTSKSHWTSTSRRTNEDPDAWLVYFPTGQVGFAGLKTNTEFVRAVRGGL